MGDGLSQDPRQRAAELHGQVLARLDEIGEGFESNRPAQVQMILALAPAWKNENTPTRQAIQLALQRHVPRVRDSDHPQLMLTSLFRLANMGKGALDLSQALQAKPRETWTCTEEEKLYHRDGWLGEYVKWAQYSKTPLPFHFWSGLTALGSACRSNWFYVHRSGPMWANQYTFLVGPPAVGKSDAMWAAHRVLERANMLIGDNRWAQINMLPGDTNQETMVVSLQPQPCPHPNPELCAQAELYWTSSAGILTLDEVTTFLGKDTWATSKRIPFLTSLWNSPSYTYRTKSGGDIVLQDCALSIIGCSAPSWLTGSITPQFFEGGFMDRINIVYRDYTVRDYAKPPPLDPVVELHLADLLAQLSHRCVQQEIVPSAKADEWFDQRYHTMEDEIRGYSKARWSIHLWKTAMMFAVGDWQGGDAPPVIERWHLEDAEAYQAIESPWFERFRKLLSETEDSAAMDRLKECIGRYRKNGITMPELISRHLKNTALFKPLSWKPKEYMGLLMMLGEVRVKGIKFYLTRYAPENAVTEMPLGMRRVK